MSQTDAQEQDSSLSALGFVSKEARRNLVIAILLIFLTGDVYLFRDNSRLHKQIEDINKAQADSANAMYNRLVLQIAEKMKPVNEAAKEINANLDKTDSLQQKIIKDNKLKL